MRRLPAERERQIIEAYEAWNPSDGSTIDDLAKSVGIARQTVYAVLQRNQVPLKGSEPLVERLKSPRDPQEEQLAGIILSGVSEHALDYLLSRILVQDRALAAAENAIRAHLDGKGCRNGKADLADALNSIEAARIAPAVRNSPGAADDSQA